MNKTWMAFLVAACLPASAEDESSIRFTNGDHLTGSPVAWDEKGVVWDSSLIERPVPFLKENILDITLPIQTPELKATDHEAIVTLTKGPYTKGGIVRGQLAEVTDDAVVIDTWYAGQLRFNRVMVDSVQIEPSDTVIYRGPNSLKDWKMTGPKDAWKYANFSFISSESGSIARDDLLADECSVAFDVEWKSDATSYKMVLFSDSADTGNPQSGYEFSMQRGGMVLRNVRTQSYLGSTHSSEVAQANRARIEIKASRLTGTIALFINDQFTDMWNDGELERSQLGNGLHFIASRQIPLRISRIRIAKWDGAIDEPLPARAGMRRMQFGFGEDGAPIAPAPKPEEKLDGQMKLANGDAIDGKVKSIQNGKVTIETSLGEVTLPVARLRTITLPPAEREVAIVRNNDVCAWMSDGGFIVFEFIKADEQTITGRSQNFGTATFRRDAFQKIEFNLYGIEPDALRDQYDW
jgi:hypothetical protein